MKSALAYSDAIDNIDFAAKKLALDITEKMVFLQHSVGILYCDLDMDFRYLSEKLHELLGFDIIGCSSIATIDSIRGYGETSAILLVISSEDHEFHIGVSKALEKDNCEKECFLAYSDLIQNIDGKVPQLGFILANNIADFCFEQALEKMTAHYGTIPLFGGFPTGFENDIKAVFMNGKIYRSNMIVMVITGELKPVFSVTNLVAKFVNRKFKVTKSIGKVIYEVDGKSFLETLEGLGMNLEDAQSDELNLFFHSNPILIEKNIYNQSITDVKVIEKVNFDDGSVTIYSPLKEGSVFSIVGLREDVIRKSAEEAVKEISRKIEENEKDGYQYALVLGASCYGRYLSMVYDRGVEGEMLKKHIPDHINVVGFYSYGEICPYLVSDSAVVNGIYNCSFILCAI